MVSPLEEKEEVIDERAPLAKVQTELSEQLANFPGIAMIQQYMSLAFYFHADDFGKTIPCLYESHLLLSLHTHLASSPVF